MLAVFGAVLVAAPAVGAAVRPGLLPLAAGNRWVLRDERGGGAATVTVVRGASGLVLRGLVGAGDLRVRPAGQAVQAWDPSERRWEPFLRLGAPARTMYAVDLAKTAFWRSLVVTVASRHATIVDGRGKTHRNSVRLTFAAREPIADAGVEEVVFAPGVGFVRITEQTIAGPRVRVLDALSLRGS